MPRGASKDDEKLQKERERIRIASQKTRQKRREEEQILRTENEKMKRERQSLATTLSDLERTIELLQEQLKEKDETLSENEQLSKELEQYRSFGSACVLFAEQFSSVDVDPGSEDLSRRMLSQVTKSGGEMSDLHSERILAESLGDDPRWRSLSFEGGVPLLSTFVKGRFRLLDDGTCEWQFNIVAPWQKDHARVFSQRYRAFWEDPRPLLSIFKSSKTSWFGNIDESTVEHLATEGNASLQRIRNSDNDKSWVFVLTHADGVKVAKSTLLPESPENMPFFALDTESQQALKATSNNSGASSSSVASNSPKPGGGKPQSSTSSPTVSGRVGVVECWSGTRASLMLDSSCIAKGENCVRGKFVESFRAWNEDIQSSDPRVAGPGVRGILISSMTQEFAQQTFGETGFNALFNFENNTVANPYQAFIDFLAISMGIEDLSGVAV